MDKSNKKVSAVSRWARMLTGPLLALSTLAGIAGTAKPAVAGSAFGGFSPPITGATDFVTGMPSCGSAPYVFGPVGMLFDGSNFFATDVCNNTLYKFPAGGGPASGATTSSNGANKGLALVGGVYYATTDLGGGSFGVQTFDHTTLAITSTVWTHGSPISAIVGDPLSSDLYVSSTDGIWRIQNPTSGSPTVTQLTTADVDGIGFTTDGTMLYASASGTNNILRYNRSGDLLVTVDTGYKVDGLVVVRPGTTMDGINVSNNVFSNSPDGKVLRIDTNAGNAVSVVASAGTTGDLAALGPDGCLYMTQTDRIEQLAPCLPPPPPPTAAGYVWADQPSTSYYVPSPAYQFNSTGATNTITRVDVGLYQVDFVGLGTTGGMVQATSYGGGASHCEVMGWGIITAPDETVVVACFNANGRADDTFTASFTKPSAPAGRMGFLWADRPTVNRYTPNPSYQYNSQGGLATVVRTGTGKYSASLPRLGAGGGGGTVAVTAYGSDGAECKVLSWGANSRGAQVVNVRCFNTAGSPGDSAFDLTYSDGTNPLGLNFAKHAFVWANAQPMPLSSYQFNNVHAGRAVNTLSQFGVGEYTVKLPDQGTTGGHVIVTAYGPGSSRCQVIGWGISAPHELVYVDCWTPFDTLVNSKFTVQWMSN